MNTKDDQVLLIHLIIIFTLCTYQLVLWSFRGHSDQHILPHSENSATEWPQNELCPGGSIIFHLICEKLTVGRCWLLVTIPLWYSGNAKLSIYLQCLLCVNIIFGFPSVLSSFMHMIVIWILLTHILHTSSTCILCTIFTWLNVGNKNIYIHQLCFVLFLLHVLQYQHSYLFLD